MSNHPIPLARCDSSASEGSRDPVDYWQLARSVALQAYAPYSNFTVGAVLIGSDGRVFIGCNVENASFGLCICAERTAATRAVTEGCRVWKSLYVVSPRSVAPCGACRQFLAEFAPNLEILISGLFPNDPIRSTRLDLLLPDAFGSSHVLPPHTK